MRILFVLENYYPNIGGVETLFKSLIDNLVKDGIEIRVLTNRINNKHPFIESTPNCKVFRFPFLNRYLFTFFAWLPALRLAYKSDLIQTTSYNAGVPAYIASFLMRKKIVITFHEVWGDLWFNLPFISRLGSYSHYYFERLLLKLRFTKFIAVSEFTRYSLIEQGLNSEKVERIYNGITYGNVAKSNNASNEIFQFLYFGRAGISKGLNILIEAIRILSIENLEFKVEMVIPENPINILDSIKGSIYKYKLDKIITITSNLSRKALDKKIMYSDAVVIPSYSEGFCFAAVETVALGTPIISSGKGALKEVVGGRHLTFDEFTPQGLADAMKDALNNKWITTQVKRFELNNTIKAYKSLYKRLINKE